MNTKNICVLVSGGGTNLQALIDAEKRGELGAGKITCVIASKADAYALTRAENNGIKTRTLIRKDFSDIASYSKAMRDILLEEKADLIDWVRGQNSDGAFECLDELPIETGYGGLAISLWNDSDDYFVCERAELDEYMSQHNSMKMGGM